MKIILLGPPGSGKGTQAKGLSKELGVVHISTGDILRQNVTKGSQLGSQAKGYMDKGALVPDELVTQMLNKRLDEADIENGFILDGYPRNLNQAVTLEGLFKQKNIIIDAVIYLDTSEPVVIQRLSGRLVCSGCGLNFHSTNMPAKVAMICDNCGGRLYQRTDDQEETVKKRLEVYKKEAAVLIKFYDQKNKLISVNADEDAPIVLDKIINLLKHNQNLVK